MGSSSPRSSGGVGRRFLSSPTLPSVFTIPAAAMLVATVSVSAPLSAPTLKLVSRLEFPWPGEHRQSVVSTNYQLTSSQQFKNIILVSGLQCEAGASYQPCVSTCPAKTCDNLWSHSRLSLACREEPCVEGCAPPSCHQGFVFHSQHSRDCINSLECQVKCRLENGTQFYEGDIMEETDSQSW